MIIHACFLDAQRLVPTFAVNYQRALYQHAHKTLIQYKQKILFQQLNKRWMNKVKKTKKNPKNI